MQSLSEGYVGLVLVITLVLLVMIRMRAELVALLVLIALEIPGIITREQALSGFSNSAVITIIGLFVIGAALERSGVAERMAGLIVRTGGTSEVRLIILVMMTSAILSLVMNNIAAGAVVLPIAMTVARRSKIPPAKLLMPLAFGASLGGMATLFTTANILISTALQDNGHQPLHFLDFLPIGTLMTLGGVIYMVVIGRRLLPSHDPLGAITGGAPLPEVYQLNERLWEVQVPPSSPIAGQTLATADLGEVHGVTVVAVFHGQEAQLMPGPDTRLAPGDVLLVAGREEAVHQIPDVTIGRETHASGYFTNPQVQTAEVIIAPRASIRGQTLKQMEFRRRYGVTVVAIWKNGQSIRTHIGDVKLDAGDALLIIGAPDRLSVLAADPALIVVTPLAQPQTPATPLKRRMALIITAVVLGLSAAAQLPTSIAVLLGFVLLVLVGCLTMDEALDSIEWKTIFVIAGMLPLSIAMEQTGLARTIGEAVVYTIGGYGFVPLVVGLYLTTMALAQILGGQVTALALAPIAIAAATATGVSPRSIGIIVAVACSSTFLTPLAHPVNLLMVGPGGYTFRDFARVGAGLTVVCLLIIVVAAHILPGG